MYLNRVTILMTLLICGTGLIASPRLVQIFDYATVWEQADRESGNYKPVFRTSATRSYVSSFGKISIFSEARGFVVHVSSPLTLPYKKGKNENHYPVSEFRAVYFLTAAHVWNENLTDGGADRLKRLNDSWRAAGSSKFYMLSRDIRLVDPASPRDKNSFSVVYHLKHALKNKRRTESNASDDLGIRLIVLSHKHTHRIRVTSRITSPVGGDYALVRMLVPVKDYRHGKLTSVSPDSYSLATSYVPPFGRSLYIPVGYGDQYSHQKVLRFADQHLLTSRYSVLRTDYASSTYGIGGGNSGSPLVTDGKREAVGLLVRGPEGGFVHYHISVVASTLRVNEFIQSDLRYLKTKGVQPTRGSDPSTGIGQ